MSRKIAVKTSKSSKKLKTKFLCRIKLAYGISDHLLLLSHIVLYFQTRVIAPEFKLLYRQQVEYSLCKCPDYCNQIAVKQFCLIHLHIWEGVLLVGRSGWVSGIAIYGYAIPTCLQIGDSCSFYMSTVMFGCPVFEPIFNSMLKPRNP